MMETKCGCFTSSQDTATSLIFQGSGYNCSFLSGTFICCENYNFLSRNKLLCCLDKYDQNAPSYVDKCRMTNQQFDAVEKLFGTGSAAYHRSIYKRYTTTDDDFALFQRSGLLYAMVLLCCFLAIPVLCFCFKTFVENWEHRYGAINHQRLADAPTLALGGTRHLIDNSQHRQHTISIPNNLGSEQRTLSDSHTYLPYVVQPPSYNSIPKEPPRYSSIFLIDNRITDSNRPEANTNDAVDVRDIDQVASQSQNAVSREDGEAVV